MPLLAKRQTTSMTPTLGRCRRGSFPTSGRNFVALPDYSGGLQSTIEGLELLLVSLEVFEL